MYTLPSFLSEFNGCKLIVSLAKSSIFARGLPTRKELQSPDIAHVLEAVLLHGFVKDDTFAEQQHRDALGDCFKQGWLHSDQHEEAMTGIPYVAYVFPTPIHWLYIAMELQGLAVARVGKGIPAEGSLRDFAISTIKFFSPDQLSIRRQIGPGSFQPPEAQYQDEFYRCCHLLTQGTVMPLPEFGSKAGRIDFFIPGKKWGVELLRDGNRLGEHSDRFSPTGKYRHWIDSNQMTEYIILDFRTTIPKKAHPGMEACLILRH